MGTNNYDNLNELEGLQFIPVNEKKIPQVKNWQKFILMDIIFFRIFVKTIEVEPNSNENIKRLKGGKESKSMLTRFYPCLF